MRLLRLLAILLATAFVVFVSAAGLKGNEAVTLFADDFSRFPPGVLSAPIGLLNGAIQEYHYIEHRGLRTHPWRNPLVHLDTWRRVMTARVRTSSSTPSTTTRASIRCS